MCDDPGVVAVVEEARSTSASSTPSALFALPQALARLGMPTEEVQAQFDGWESLSPQERQFQLCLNAAEGEFEK